MQFFTPTRRKAIYNLAVALGACLTAFGVLTDTRAAAISGVVLALTNVLATLNVTDG